MKTRLLVFLLCAFSIQLSAQIAFQQHTVIDSTYGTINPKSIASADIDNDGFKDLLIAGYSEAAWARSIDGAGLFEQVTPITTEFTDVNNILAADFDSDNDLDVIIYARGGNSFYEVLYAENTDGLGSFSAPMVLASTAAIIRLNIQVLDIDNDGDIDIAYGSNNNISWLENTDGQATFIDHFLLDDNDGFYSADLDGDQIADFIADDGYDLRAYKLNADGTLSFFETMNTFSLNNDHKAGDIDGDGDNDVVTFFENGTTRQIHWYDNIDGLGTFANRQVLFDLPSISGSSNSDVKGLELVDVDGDNLLDVVTFESRRAGMSWYKNLGNTVFDTEQIISDQVPNISSFTVDDIDNDGALDILCTDYTLNEYAWFKNQSGLGDFGEKQRISSYAYFVNHVDYGDIDGDGDLDLVSSSHGDNKIAWYDNFNGLGYFAKQQQLISSTTDGARDVFALDMDGDTDTDVLVSAYLDASTNEYQLIWFENDGTGVFINEHIFESTTEAILRIQHADVDGDGDQDIICGQEDSVLALYKNNGDGSFAPKTIFSESGFSYLLSLQVTDIDGDADIDVLASYNGNEIIWHENDGSGNLESKHIIIDEMHYPSSIFATDVDGDTDMDVLFVNQYAGEIGYFLNEDGQGSFGAPIVTSSLLQTPSAIYSLDMDADGDMDIISNSTTAQKFVWFPNDGMANFGDAIEISSLIGRVNHITSADINGDDKIDLITSSYDDDQVAWFENLGTLFTNTISGIVRLDADANDCDANDAGIPNLLIQSDNGVNSFATFTQADGSYSIAANQENFTTIIASPLANYYASNPASHNFDFSGLNNTNSPADFCVQASQQINDLNIVIYPNVNDPRPGFETSYRLVFTNKGTVPLSGHIDFEFDDTKLNFLNASEAITTQTANSLSFDYNELNPFETRFIDLAFSLFAPPITSSGDILNASASIYPIAADASENDNTFGLSQTVINSYDPNDIRVLEGDRITIDQADQYLHYIIRFQNTGTASAINIRVRNVLDEHLDWSSLQLESLSHTGRVEIVDGNKVDFIFDNIHLADSTSNEAASHGFIVYKIKPKSDVVIGDVFANTADIYFDFNPPIITNTVHTEIIETVSTQSVSTHTSKLYPNPVHNRLTIESELNMQLIQIYSINGDLLKTQPTQSKKTTIDVAGLTKGLYFVKIEAEDGIRYLKFVKS